MTLHLHRAPRADHLAAGLADLLRRPLPDPFDQELVLVPAKGVERWLSQQLSHRLGPAAGRDDGVCAGVRFRSPRSLVAEVTGRRDHDPWSPDALVWPLLEVVDAHAGQAWASTLSRHLGHGLDAEEAELRRGRRYAVARRLAGLFSSYAVQRPALLEDWEAGRVTDGAGGPLDDDLVWQARLWPLVVAAVGEPSPGERHRDTLDRLERDPASVALPARLSLFGHTRIPVTEVELLRALGRHRDVHLWVPHPSDAAWRALGGARAVVARAEDDSHQRVAHPLFVSLGRDLRELERLLLTADPVDEPVSGLTSAPAADAPATLLRRLQRDLADDRAPSGVARAADGGAAHLDDSVQVHACHGPARQVEVLREVLLGLLADDPTLEPRDVLVMCPDIEAYAPLVTAAFGLAGPDTAEVDRVSEAGGVHGATAQHPGHRLRVLLADRALTQTNPLLGVVGQLLDIAGGRAEASEVLDLLHAEPVRTRFGLDEDDLQTITAWVGAAGVRWAFDADHRAEFGLAGFPQNTWRFGLDRVLTGVAVSGDADRYFGPTLPLDDVGSSVIDLAGRFAELLDRLRSVTDRLDGVHTVAEWSRTLVEAVELLTRAPAGEEWQLGQVHRELGALAGDVASAEQLLRLADVRSLVRQRLGGRPTRANFRTGTLTVCTMTPMRSVPHRVVCLLGLDDGVFPRATVVDGDDVLARRPLTGERDPRSEDRQLMLDAVLAATDHLVITYTGAAESTGAPRPPAVPLQELLDSLAQTAPGVDVVRRQPLQSFSPDNLRPPRPFSFDPQAKAAATAAAKPRRAPEGLADLDLPPRGGDVELADLVAFLKAPVRQFLRQRLELTLPEEHDETRDAIPVDPDGLERWSIGDRMLRDLLQGHTPDATLQREWRRGELPPGRLGWRMARQLVAEAAPVAELTRDAREGRRAEALDVRFDLGGGRALTGTVTDVFGDRVVRSTFSRLGPTHWLEAWVPLLALAATRPARVFRAGAIGRGPKGYRDTPDQATDQAVWGGVPDPEARLRDLVAIYDAGMRGPLPLAAKSSYAWACAHGKPEPVKANAAEREWRSDRFPKEDARAEHVRVWGAGHPFAALLEEQPRPGEEHVGEATRFGALAARLWLPMLEHRR